MEDFPLLPCGKGTVTNLAFFCIPSSLSSEEDGERRGLGSFGDIDQLLETRDAQRHVLGGHTSVVEGVEGHLSGWFSERLGSKSTNHLTRLNLQYTPRK